MTDNPIDPLALNAMQAQGFYESFRPADAVGRTDDIAELPSVGPGFSVVEDTRHAPHMDHVVPKPSMTIEGGGA
jgi:hypothetical protein